MVGLGVGIPEESCLSAHCSQHRKDQFLRCSGGKADLEWLKLSFFGVFLSLLNVMLCKQRLIEEERLLEHISKILEN